MTRNEVIKTVKECFPTLSYDQQELMADAIMRRLERQPIQTVNYLR